MKNKKLYFENEDATLCMPLQTFIEDAKYDGRKEITLIEAIPDDGTTDMIFCSLAGEVCERGECTKRNCPTYTPNKSGRGVCLNRGRLYLHGEKVTIKIP